MVKAVRNRLAVFVRGVPLSDGLPINVEGSVPPNPVELAANWETVKVMAWDKSAVWVPQRDRTSSPRSSKMFTTSMAQSGVEVAVTTGDRVPVGVFVGEAVSVAVRDAVGVIESVGV